MSTVVFSAPQGWGKTRNAQQLRREFGCSKVVDGWDPWSDPITRGALHLTNVHADHIALPRGIRVVSRGREGGSK